MPRRPATARTAPSPFGRSIPSAEMRTQDPIKQETPREGISTFPGRQYVKKEQKTVLYSRKRFEKPENSHVNVRIGSDLGRT